MESEDEQEEVPKRLRLIDALPASEEEDHDSDESEDCDDEEGDDDGDSEEEMEQDNAPALNDTGFDKVLLLPFFFCRLIYDTKLDIIKQKILDEQFVDCVFVSSSIQKTFEMAEGLKKLHNYTFVLGTPTKALKVRNQDNGFDFISVPNLVELMAEFLSHCVEYLHNLPPADFKMVFDGIIEALSALVVRVVTHSGDVWTIRNVTEGDTNRTTLDHTINPIVLLKNTVQAIICLLPALRHECDEFVRKTGNDTFFEELEQVQNFFMESKGFVDANFNQIVDNFLTEWFNMWNKNGGTVRNYFHALSELYKLLAKKLEEVCSSDEIVFMMSEAHRMFKPRLGLFVQEKTKNNRQLYQTINRELTDLEARMALLFDDSVCQETLYDLCDPPTYDGDPIVLHSG